MTSVSDAIVALSSPPGIARRGLVRVSGPDLSALVQTLESTPLRPRCWQPVRWPWSADAILPIAVCWFPGPGSFTGEDILECYLPGQVQLLERFCSQLIHIGRLQGMAIRHAEPGEYTRRAFLAGRIDLTRAEGIAATIGAISDGQLKAAGLLRRGRLGELTRQWMDRLVHLLASVEAEIDFVDEEDIQLVDPAVLDHDLASLSDAIGQLLDQSCDWSQLSALPWVVLIGAANAGKSALFNALLGHERAVTCDLAGTTRDVLCEPLVLPGGECMLVDVAGWESTMTDPIQQQMVQQMERALAHASVAVCLHPADAPQASVSMPVAPDCRVIHVVSKCDLADPLASDRIAVSARTGAGIDRLRAALDRCLADRLTGVQGQQMALQQRHRSGLGHAVETLQQARRILQAGTGVGLLADAELVAGYMREALDHLSAMSGWVSPDAVLGEIFGRFCIGK